MTLLCWDKPEKVMSAEDWKSIGYDGSNPGGFTSNMSRDDIAKWKAKLVGHKTGFPQVEIRKDGGFVVIVSLKGYKYKNYDTRQTPENIATWTEQAKLKWYAHWNGSIEPAKQVVHIASSGPQAFTMEQFQEFKLVIQEAEDFLKKLETT